MTSSIASSRVDARRGDRPRSPMSFQFDACRCLRAASIGTIARGRVAAARGSSPRSDRCRARGTARRRSSIILSSGSESPNSLLRQLVVDDDDALARRRLVRREVAAGVEVAAAVDLLPVAGEADDVHAAQPAVLVATLRAAVSMRAPAARTVGSALQRLHVREREPRIAAATCTSRRSRRTPRT